MYVYLHLKKKDNIISILEQHGATDDLLAIVRKEKGIELDADCRFGQKIEFKPGSIAKKHQARQHFSRNLKWDPSDFRSEKLVGS